MPKYDLIAIDIDGTLINGVHEITQPVYDAVQRVVDSGSQIVLCTGRPYPGAVRYMEELGLTKEGDFIINYHGALVQRTDTGEVVVDHQLNYDDLLKWDAFAKESGANFLAVRSDSVYADQFDFSPVSLIEPFVNNLNLRVRKFQDLDADLTYSKFIMQDDVAVIDRLESKVPDAFHEQYTVMRSVDNSLEVLNKDASKGRSLKDLAKHLGVPRERVMAIGDSGNDVDMVDYAGLGVAMGNAVPAVKEVADAVTASNEEDGVAVALNRYLFDQ